MSKAKPAPETDAPEADAPDVDASAVSDEPAWLADAAYAGPLTADQAERRLARHGHHVTKPAQTPDTK